MGACVYRTRPRCEGHGHVHGMAMYDHSLAMRAQIAFIRSCSFIMAWVIMAFEMWHTQYALLLHMSWSCLLALVIASVVGLSVVGLSILQVCWECLRDLVSSDSPPEWDDDDALFYEEDYDAPLPYYEPLHIHDDEMDHFHPWLHIASMEDFE